MKYRINGKYSHNKDKETDRFLISLLGFIASMILSFFRDFGSLTGVKVRLKRSFGGAVDIESGASYLKTALHTLEGKITKARIKYFKAPDKWYEKIQAYYKFVNLTPREELEVSLKTEESLRESEVSDIHSPSILETQNAPIITTPGGVNPHDFTNDLKKAELFRRLDVAIEKLTLSLLNDRLKFLPILFRKFEPLEKAQIPSFEIPKRTNILYEFTLVKCIVLGVVVFLSLIPEYLIVQAFATHVLQASPLKASLFPLLVFGLSKFISVLMTPMVRRFMRSTPTYSKYLVVVATLGFLFTVSYGYLTAINLNESKTNDQIEVIKDDIAAINTEIFMSTEDEVPAELLERKKKKEQKLEKALHVIQNDPYGGKLISFIGLSLASGIILISTAFLFAVFFTVLKAVSLKRKADKAQDDIIECAEEYANLLSTLHSARELYLMCLYLLYKKNVIERMRMLRPSLADFDSLTASEIKNMEVEINKSLTQKN
ncbi:hypothetical protein [Roseivirga pacifica]|uniref:hypothetical protein n=1 Tax=Roseivirga pacifica TaxID=1267423 RepID=UPI003BAD92FD